MQVEHLNHMEEKQVQGQRRRSGWCLPVEGVQTAAPDGSLGTVIVRVDQSFQIHHFSGCLIKRRKFWYLADNARMGLIRARLST